MPKNAVESEDDVNDLLLTLNPRRPSSPFQFAFNAQRTKDGHFGLMKEILPDNQKHVCRQQERRHEREMICQ